MCQPNSQLHHLACRLHHLSTQGPIVPVSRWYQSIWALECFTLPKTQNVRNCLSQRCNLPTLIQSLQLKSELFLWPIDKYIFNYRCTHIQSLSNTNLYYTMVWYDNCTIVRKRMVTTAQKNLFATCLLVRGGSWVSLELFILALLSPQTSPSGSIRTLWLTTVSEKILENWTHTS